MSDSLKNLHELLTQEFIDRVASGGATAAELNAARRFLKDNNIDCSTQAPPEDIQKLAGIVPFPRAEGQG